MPPNDELYPDYELSEVVGDAADRLVSAQIFLSGGGASAMRNISGDLSDAARDAQGAPPSHLAARALIKRVRPRDVVILCAGFFVTDAMVTETDGPIGAVMLGRAVAVALDATPVFLTEITNIPRLAVLVRAAGLEVSDLATARVIPSRAAILPLPIKPIRAVTEAAHCFDSTAARAMISVEKPSPTRDGTCRTGSGFDFTDFVGKVGPYIDEARRRGVLTIGIADGGNEVGMGKIADTVRRIVPTGEIMGAVLDTDILVVATISNWGAYAVEACLAAALHLPEALHPLAMERRVVEASVEVGMVDPTTGLAHGWVDGTPPICSESILELLRNMVELRLSQQQRTRIQALSPAVSQPAPSTAADTLRRGAGELAAKEEAYFATDIAE